MWGGEGFACQVCDSVTELIVTRRDKAAPITVEGVADREIGIAAVTVCGKVWGIYAVPQEEGVTPFLCPQPRFIYCGRLNCQPGPGLCCLSQSTCALDRVP